MAGNGILPDVSKKLSSNNHNNTACIFKDIDILDRQFIYRRQQIKPAEKYV
jgi:hypothetical protein